MKLLPLYVIFLVGTIACSSSDSTSFDGNREKNVSLLEETEKASGESPESQIEAKIAIENKIAQVEEIQDEATEPRVALGANLVSFELPDSYTSVNAYIMSAPQEKAVKVGTNPVNKSSIYALKSPEHKDFSIMISAVGPSGEDMSKMMAKLNTEEKNSLEMGMVELEESRLISGKVFLGDKSANEDHSGIQIAVADTDIRLSSKWDGSYSFYYPDVQGEVKIVFKFPEYYSREWVFDQLGDVEIQDIILRKQITPFFEKEDDTDLNPEIPMTFKKGLDLPATNQNPSTIQNNSVIKNSNFNSSF